MGSEGVVVCLTLYVIGVVVAIAFIMTETEMFKRYGAHALSVEARMLCVIPSGLVWPSVVLAMILIQILKGFAFAGRGIRDLWRVTRPRRRTVDPLAQAKVISRRKRPDPDESWGKDPWFGGEP